MPKTIAGAAASGRGYQASGKSAGIVWQWARYESILNLALAGSPMRLICLYDCACLPDHILDFAVCTHPERVENGCSVSCSSFVSPEEFLPGAPPTPPAAARELTLEGAAFCLWSADPLAVSLYVSLAEPC
jgi:hypothetical protein